MPTQPASLWLLRHGQSLGNVARDAARAPGTLTLDIAERDMDVPLSEYGQRQAEAFGHWLGREQAEELPEVVIVSPYLRAVQTAEAVLAAAGIGELRVHLDERLRERELGILDLLTREGVAAKYPDEAKRRERLGKFYHRPPGGESWVDVALRLRSFRDSISLEFDGRRVLVVTHEVVIVMIRYLLEDLTEETALALSTARRLANCSLTSYVTGADGRLNLDRDAWTAPLEEEDAPVTKAHDAPVASRADTEHRDVQTLGPDLIDRWPLPIDEAGDKHSRGTVLVIGGSPVTPGAVILAGIAALRMGAGRLQLATADSPAPAVAVAVPESLVMPLPFVGDDLAIAGAVDAVGELLEGADAVLVGPGMRSTRGPAVVTDFVSAVLSAVSEHAVVVLDALAQQTLDLLDADVLAPIAGRLVITPNREELDRLGASAFEVAQRYGAVVTSFGHVVAPDGRRWECVDGTPGLGTSGSGDVLAGLVAGAAARCTDAAHAACWGTYVHAAAGARLSERMGTLGFLARELLDEVPLLWRDLESRAAD